MFRVLSALALLLSSIPPSIAWGAAFGDWLDGGALLLAWRRYGG